jgi:hypothetical protein
LVFQVAEVLFDADVLAVARPPAGVESQVDIDPLSMR